MIEGLHRRLRFGATMTPTLWRRFITLDLDDLPVADCDPYTTFDFTACAATRTDALYLPGTQVFTFGKGLQR